MILLDAFDFCMNKNLKPMEIIFCSGLTGSHGSNKITNWDRM
jgi:hypothetical protein